MPFTDPDSLRRFRTVTIMGIGRFGGGAGAARFFAQLGARVIATDLAPAEKLQASLADLEGLGITFVLGEHRPEDFIHTDLIIANQAARPDTPLLAQARAAGTPVWSETGLALSMASSPWVGVTGSSGKSTTTCLIAAMLKESDPATMLGGNIGGDLLTRVADHPSSAPLVVELSSFQLSYIGDDFANGRVAPPRVAVITNLAPNHLDWHRGMDEYLAAKRALLLSQTANDWAVLNVDDYRLAAWAVTAPGRVVRCAMDDPGGDDAGFIDGDAIALRIGGALVLHCPVEGYRLPGRHNLYNAVTAAAASYVMREDARAIRAGLIGFEGLPHRLQPVAKVNSRLFVDDSKSTTPEAAITALAAFTRPIVLIAGGYDKFAPFEELADAVQRHAKAVVLVGAAGGRLGAAIREAVEKRLTERPSPTIVEAGEDFSLAVREAYRLAPEDGVVLLSPACASYGMFVNYEERGARFRELANALAEEQTAGERDHAG